MKRFLKYILCLIMFLSMSACQAKKTPEEMKELIRPYAGRYLLVDIPTLDLSENEQYEIAEEYIRETWENRTLYEYLEIEEDGKVCVYKVENGETAALISDNVYLDPQKSKFYTTSDNSKEDVEFEGDELVWYTNDNVMVFRKTDEIPE